MTRLDNNIKNHKGMMVMGMVGVAFAVGAVIAAIAVGQGRQAATAHKLDGAVNRRIKSFQKFASSKFGNVSRPERVCETDAPVSTSDYVIA